MGCSGSSQVTEPSHKIPEQELIKSPLPQLP